jgi:hypothetical protein
VIGRSPDTTGRLIDVTPPDTDAPSSADAQRLRAERDAAVARARELEMELGQLRGTVKRLELMMWRRTARRQLWQARLDRVMAKVRRS